MNKNVRLSLRLFFHTVGCVGYVFLNNWAAVTYKAANGGFASHGATFGMASVASHA